jgi:hypothetical protein
LSGTSRLLVARRHRRALANIRDAIHDYLEVAKELAGERNLREVEVPA